MTDILLPSVLLRQVTPEAMTAMARTLPFDSSYHVATVWQSEKSGTMSICQRDGSSRAASKATIVHDFIEAVVRATKRHPADVLRDLIGRPVSIPAQGWRVPRECDYGRKDVLEAHRFPGHTKWVTYLTADKGVGPASESGEVRIHDIAELPE